MICSCGRDRHHRPDCLVAQAMRWRCPECRSRRDALDDSITHARHCELKEFQP